MHIHSVLTRPAGSAARLTRSASDEALDRFVPATTPEEAGPSLRELARAADRLAAPERVSQCYAGTNTIMLPNGRMVGTSEGLARRTLDPAAGIIEELVLDKGPRGVQEYRVLMNVCGNRLTMTEANGAFTGSGELVGEPWNWTEMKHTAQLPDGSRVETRESMGAHGMTGEKRVYSPDGVLRILIRNEFAPIAEAEFEVRRGKLLS